MKNRPGPRKRASKGKAVSRLDVADHIHSAAIRVLRGLRRQDDKWGLSAPRLSALSVVVFGGPLTLGDLARAEQVRPPTMSRIVAGLVRAGLVRRGKTEDGRRVRLEATAKGTKILQQGRRRRVESLAKAVSSFSDKEQQQLGELIGLLQQVIRNL